MADVGSVSSWVSSGLTSVSLALAAYTYYRSSSDRRRDQAARVSLWWVNPRRGQVRNSNDVAVTVTALIPGAARSGSLGLGPGETRGLSLPAALAGRSAEVVLSVADSYGRGWIRHADGRLKPVGKPHPRAEPVDLTWSEAP